MQSIVSSCPSPVQSPSVEIIEQGIIMSAQDLARFSIINWNRLNGYWGNNPARALGVVDRWLAKRVGYTRARIDMKRFPERSDFPEWEHLGTPHKRLGQLFWNAFRAMEIGELKLADSPDLEGMLFMDGYRNVPFLGDIGEVSASTFIFSMLRLNAGDLWISVPDAFHQIILEPLVNLRDEWENGREPQKPMAILEKPSLPQRKKKAKQSAEALAHLGLVQHTLL